MCSGASNTKEFSQVRVDRLNRFGIPGCQVSTHRAAILAHLQFRRVKQFRRESQGSSEVGEKAFALKSSTRASIGC